MTINGIKSFFITSAVLALLLTSCRQEPAIDGLSETENPDWYILKAPEARAIEGVYGDIDGTLVITTGTRVYQTKDKGKTWLTGNYQTPIGLFGFVAHKDTLLALNTRSQTGDVPDQLYQATLPSHYSIDLGATWLPYTANTSASQSMIPLNRIKASSGTEYTIDEVITTNIGSGDYVETVGIKTSSGKRLTLPQDHQLKSLYFDRQSRLYISASAPLCGKGNAFAFCGDQNGILYVSKLPQQ
ncbi:hypothetical protein [Fibrella aquatica]|uniref:hypothetical protein n=1 Tax=Fibrella aquatica TaxID=3242487 RepID=UPI003520DF7C